MDEDWLIVCPKMDENCSTRHWSFPCNVVCKKHLGLCFFLKSDVFLGNFFLLKLLLVKTYGEKIQQVWLVVVGLGSSF